MSSVSTSRTLRYFCVGLLIGALVGCGSDNPLGEATPHPAGFAVPWPPDDAPARTASDDTVELLGNEFAQLGGDAAEAGTTVALSGGGDLPYAIYTLGGFLAPLEFTLLSLDAERDEASPGDGTQLYVGLANYALQRWEWFAADSGGWDTGALAGRDYCSPNGTAAVAVVLDGPGTGTVNTLTFRRTGDTTLRPPDPITAEPWVGRINISWDRVPVAEGYNVYRDEEPSLPAPQKLNTDPLTQGSYVDRSVTPGVMYYYFVTSVARGAESARSMMLDVFAPEVDLPSPTNVRMIEETATTVTVGWDWELGPPSDFQLYLEDHKDFNLVSPLQAPTTDGDDCQCRFTKLAEGTKYRWRVCAVLGDRRGRMTDDAPVSTKWDWNEMESVGMGDGTVVAIKAGNDLAAAYYNGTTINFSRRYDGFWVEETVLDSEPFTFFIDLAYGGGKFIVVGWTVMSGDLWAAMGTPGNMVAERIHGDGSTAQGHPNSGLGCVATATSSLFVVVHTYYEQRRTIMQTRPISGGTWSIGTLSTDAYLETPYNLASDGSNAYLLMKDINANALLFSDMNSEWTMVEAIPPGSPAVYFNSDLVRFGNKWVSPLRNATNELFIMAENTTTPWTITQLSDEDVGSGARMDAAGNQAAIVYTSWGRWWYAFTDDGGEVWQFSEIKVSDYHLRYRPDIVFLDGSPYLVFADYVTGEIMAAKGTPPEP